MEGRGWEEGKKLRFSGQGAGGRRGRLTLCRRLWGPPRPPSSAYSPGGCGTGLGASSCTGSSPHPLGRPPPWHRSRLQRRRRSGRVSCLSQGREEQTPGCEMGPCLLSVPYVFVVCPQLNCELLEQKESIFHISHGAQGGVLGKYLKNRTGLSQSWMISSFEETDVREGDLHLKIHGEKWCWAGALASGLPPGAPSHSSH